MKKQHIILMLLVAYLSSIDTISAQNKSRDKDFTTHAEKVNLNTSTGKYKDDIFWLLWDKRQTPKKNNIINPDDDDYATSNIIKNDDYLYFESPSGMCYTFVIKNIIKGWVADNVTKPDNLQVVKYNDYDLSNFMTKYNWGKGSGAGYTKGYKDKNISLIAQEHEIQFDLYISATMNGTTEEIEDFAFVIAGTESLGGDGEYYSLEILPNTVGGTITNSQVIQPIEAYSNTGQYSLKLIPEKGTETGTNTIKGVKLKVTNDEKVDGKGDLMLAATHVQKLRIKLLGYGNQHIALGVIDLLDYGDAPNSYEVKTSDGKDDFARHFALPALTGELRETANSWTSKPPVEDLVELDKPILGFGRYIDSEEAKYVSAAGEADEDDKHGYIQDEDGKTLSDEDGIPSGKWFKNCKGPIWIHNEHHTKTAYLTIWIDANQNGHFEDSEKFTEVIPASEKYKNGAWYYLDYEDKFGADFDPDPSDTYIMRCRLSYTQGLGVSGLSTSGEVEDHKIQFITPVAIASKNVSCNDGEKGQATISNLPETGWKIVLKKDDGTILSTWESFSSAGNPYKKVIKNLDIGDYSVEISNGSENCSYTKTFSIQEEPYCDDDEYAPDCENPTMNNYPKILGNGIEVNQVSTAFDQASLSAGSKCGVNATGNFRRLDDANDHLTFTFSKAIYSVDVWLLDMGRNYETTTNWGTKYNISGEDSATFEIGNSPSSTSSTGLSIDFATQSCNGIASISGNEVKVASLKVPKGVNKNNLTNFRVTISSSTPFTTLKIINPNNRKGSISLEEKGLGFFADLCLNSIDIDTDGDGVVDSKDLDDDNDGILDSDESDKHCKEVIVQPKIKPVLLSSHTISNPDYTVDDNENSYAYFTSSSDEIMVDFGRGLPVGTKINILGEGGKRNVYVKGSMENNNTDTWESPQILDFSNESAGKCTKTYIVQNSPKRYLHFERGDGIGYPRIYDITTEEKTKRYCHIEGRDADNDGIPNHYDLDSDNDGCPDATEGTKHITSLVDASGTLRGGNGVNPVSTPSMGNYNKAVLKNICGSSSCVDPKGVPLSGGGQKEGGSQIALSYEITQNPSNITICEGANAVFNATATSDPSKTLDYEWQQSTDGGTTWTDIAGKSGTIASGTPVSLSLSNLTYASNNYKYRVVYRHENNFCGEESSEATLVVKPKPNYEITPVLAKCFTDYSKIEVTMLSAANDYELWIIDLDKIAPNNKLFLKHSSGNNYEVVTDGTGSDRVTISKVQLTSSSKIIIELKRSGNFKVYMKTSGISNCECDCQ